MSQFVLGLENYDEMVKRVENERLDDITKMSQLENILDFTAKQSFTNLESTKSKRKLSSLLGIKLSGRMYINMIANRFGEENDDIDTPENLDKDITDVVDFHIGTSIDLLKILVSNHHNIYHKTIKYYKLATAENKLDIHLISALMIQTYFVEENFDSASQMWDLIGHRVELYNFLYSSLPAVYHDLLDRRTREELINKYVLMMERQIYPNFSFPHMQDIRFLF